MRLLISVVALSMTYSMSTAVSKVRADENAAETDANDGTPSQTLLDRWKKLAVRKAEITTQLRKLESEFATAQAARKAEIREEFTVSLKEFQQQLLPKMVAIAAEVYEQHPQEHEAGEILIGEAMEKSQYARAKQIGKQLLDAGRNSREVFSITGMSLFATHEFKAARDLLTQAKQENKLDPRLGGRYLDAAEKYIELWKKERSIRAAESEAAPEKQLPRVVMKTNQGDIELELFENEAPNTVANFVSLVEKRKYDGVRFHRVIPNFMVQGGDPNTLDDNQQNDGQGGPGYTIKCECVREEARMHFRGSLSMAHAGKDSGGSQFFITHLPTDHLNPHSGNRSEHTVFGRVVKGMDVVDGLQKGDKIVEARVPRKRDHEYKPVTLPRR